MAQGGSSPRGTRGRQIQHEHPAQGWGAGVTRPHGMQGPLPASWQPGMACKGQPRKRIAVSAKKLMKEPGAISGRMQDTEADIKPQRRQAGVFSQQGQEGNSACSWPGVSPLGWARPHHLRLDAPPVYAAPPSTRHALGGPTPSRDRREMECKGQKVMAGERWRWDPRRGPSNTRALTVSPRCR